MDEKKKLTIVGAVFVVVLAVGAFRLIGGGDSTPAPVKPKAAAADAKKADDKQAPQNALATLELAPRDPFKAESLGEPAATVNPGQATPPNPVQRPKDFEEAAEQSAMRRHHLSPLPPFGDGAGLPGAPVGANGISVKPEFNYVLSGVILGSHPAAVFVDAQGGQKLVSVGGSVDGDTRVISIAKGTVTVSFRGKMLRISGGNGK